MTETLWVTDEELIERSGVAPEHMRRLLTEFDKNPLSGFPKKQRLYENKRYMPAVEEYWATINRLPNNDRPVVPFAGTRKAGVGR